MKTKRPRIFIGSSQEGLNFANNLSIELNSWASPYLWTNIFSAGEVTVDSLLDEISTYDCSVFIWTEDDKIESRNIHESIARDNVIFETGMSYGLIGRKFTFIVKVGKLKEISDLKGITFIQYHTGDHMKKISDELKKSFDENSKKSKEFKTKVSKLNFDFDEAERQTRLTGDALVEQLEKHMLEFDKDAFTSSIRELNDKYTNVSEGHLWKITSLCEAMGLPYYAEKVISRAHINFPRSNNLTVKLIDVLIELGNEQPDKRTEAKKLTESFFSIVRSENDLPVFTKESLEKQISYKGNLETIMNAYLIDDGFQEVLSLTTSYEQIVGQNVNAVQCKSYRAHALSQIGQVDNARKLYEEIVKEAPNDKRLRELAKTLFYCGEIEKGYCLFELNACNYFTADSLISLAKSMQEYEICRTEQGLVNTSFNRFASKKAVVPLLFKAIEIAPYEETLRNVKTILVTLGAKEEFDFIKDNEQTAYDIFRAFKNDPGRVALYNWDTLQYIEDNYDGSANIGEKAIGFQKKIFEILTNEKDNMRIILGEE